MTAGRWYLAVGLATLSVAAASSVLGVLPGEPVKRGTAQTDYGRPVAIDVEAQAVLVKRVESFRASCFDGSRIPSSPEFAPLLDAIADVDCQHSTAGPQHIDAYRFRSAAQLNRDYAAYRRSRRGAAGACDGTTGTTAWASRDGNLVGGMLCFYAGAENDFVLAWTDDSRNTLFIARGPDRPAMFEWWQRVVRPQSRYPSALERKLLEMVSSHVDRDQCRRDETGGSPMARAAIACTLSANLGGAAYFELHTPNNLDRYLHDIFDGASAKGLPRADAACTTRAFQRGTWRTSGRGTRGTLACMPVADSRVLIWTIDDIGLYGYLSARGLSSPGELYTMWERNLRGIGS